MVCNRRICQPESQLLNDKPFAEAKVVREEGRVALRHGSPTSAIRESGGVISN
jgi:hypothetical protein